MGKPRERSTIPARKGKVKPGGRATSLRRPGGMLPMTRDLEEAGREPVVKAAPFVPRTPAQGRYAAAIASNDLVFATGPAGVGKTYVGATLAAEMFLAGDFDGIIICRPAVEAGEKLGYMPGDMNEKMDSYMTPLIEVLNKRLGRSHVELLVKSKKIEVLPLAFMRGRSLEKKLVILDEAQNTTRTQMKMFLTRIGEGARFIVDGDITQIDLPDPTQSGLIDAINRMEGVPGVEVCTFEESDIVRSGLCRLVVAAYAKRL